MDPVTEAIVAAVSSSAISGVTKMGQQALSNGYSKLKDLLAKKFGPKSNVVNAVKDLEANPKSTARKEVVREEVTAAKADQDKELLEAAQALIKSIKALPGGTQIIQTAIGDQNIQIAGDSNTVNVGTRKSKK